MSVQIEARPYGPDSTPEEIEALKGRVYMHTDGVIMYRDVPVLTEFTIDLFQDRIDELLRTSECHSMLLDLTESGRPNAAQRDQLRNRMRGRRDQLKQMAVFTGRNLLMNVAARFVLSTVFHDFSVHKTQAEAELAIRDAAQWGDSPPP